MNNIQNWLGKIRNHVDNLPAPGLMVGIMAATWFADIIMTVFREKSDGDGQTEK